MKRRTFVARGAWFSALGVGAAQAAQDAPAKTSNTTPPKSEPHPTTQHEPPKPKTVADHLADAIALKYAGKLSPEELAEIRREIAGDYQSGQRLAALKLANHEGPVGAPSAIYRLETQP